MEFPTWNHAASAFAEDLLQRYDNLPVREQTAADRLINEGINIGSLEAGDPQLRRDLQDEQNRADYAEQRLLDNIRETEERIASLEEEIKNAKAESKSRINAYRVTAQRRADIESIKRLENIFRRKIEGKSRTPSASLIESMIKVCESIDTLSAVRDVPQPTKRKDGTYVINMDIDGQPFSFEGPDPETAIYLAEEAVENSYEKRKSVQSYRAWKDSLSNLAALYSSDQIKTDLGPDYDEGLQQSIMDLVLCIHILDGVSKIKEAINIALGIILD